MPFALCLYGCSSHGVICENYSLSNLLTALVSLDVFKCCNPRAGGVSLFHHMCLTPPPLPTLFILWDTCASYGTHVLLTSCNLARSKVPVFQPSLTAPLLRINSNTSCSLTPLCFQTAALSPCFSSFLSLPLSLSFLCLSRFLSFSALSSLSVWASHGDLCSPASGCVGPVWWHT